MNQYVVTLRDGRRIEVEADLYERLEDCGPQGHSFTTEASASRYADERVLCVQRRDGFRLEQLWP